MPQIFPQRANTIARGSVVVALGLVVAVVTTAYAIDGASYMTREDIAKAQPIPFSHEHHVRGLGIDCRYCHTSVEDASSAGMPSTDTCMTCHSQIWDEADMLEPVRRSYREEDPIEWVRVHDLPDFVYFDHSIHVRRGVGCSTCHGAVDRMPLVWIEHPLRMDWCLDCHRNPLPYIRPRDEVFSMSWQPADASSEVEMARALARLEGYRGDAPAGRLDHCYVCHR